MPPDDPNAALRQLVEGWTATVLPEGPSRAVTGPPDAADGLVAAAPADGHVAPAGTDRRAAAPDALDPLGSALHCPTSTAPADVVAPVGSVVLNVHHGTRQLCVVTATSRRVGLVHLALLDNLRARFTRPADAVLVVATLDQLHHHASTLTAHPLDPFPKDHLR